MCRLDLAAADNLEPSRLEQLLGIAGAGKGAFPLLTLARMIGQSADKFGFGVRQRNAQPPQLVHDHSA